MYTMCGRSSLRSVCSAWVVWSRLSTITSHQWHHTPNRTGLRAWCCGGVCVVSVVCVVCVVCVVVCGVCGVVCVAYAGVWCACVVLCVCVCVCVCVSLRVCVLCLLRGCGCACACFLYVQDVGGTTVYVRGLNLNPAGIYV